MLDGAQAQTLGHWRDKVRTLGVGPELAPATIDNSIQRIVYEAVLGERQLDLVYCARNNRETKRDRFSPLALISRQGMLYFVGPLWDYDNVVQLALHRMREAAPVDAPIHVPADFDIDRYLRTDREFSYPTGHGRIAPELLLDADVAFHLEERP